MKKLLNVDKTFNGMRIDRFLRNHFGQIPQSLIEKNLNKLEDINREYSDISQKLQSSILDINELINELENKLNSIDHDEIDFDEVDEKIYQYQQLSKFFEVEPENLFSIKEDISNEIDTLENFDREKNILFKKYTNDLNHYKQEALKVSNLRKIESKKISAQEFVNYINRLNLNENQIISEKNTEKFFDRNHIHLHVPAGATPKDGPSAGITMACALYSLAKQKPIIPNLAMTGELTLTGLVMPIGGVKEKTIAARRARVTQLLFPDENRKDYEELDESITEGINPYFVKNFDEVLKIGFPGT